MNDFEIKKMLSDFAYIRRRYETDLANRAVGNKQHPRVVERLDNDEDGKKLRKILKILSNYLMPDELPTLTHTKVKYKRRKLKKRKKTTFSDLAVSRYFVFDEDGNRRYYGSHSNALKPGFKLWNDRHNRLTHDS